MCTTFKSKSKKKDKKGKIFDEFCRNVHMNIFCKRAGDYV